MARNRHDEERRKDGPPGMDPDGSFNVDDVGGGGDPDQTSELIDSLTRERDDFKDKWLRAMAEYQNFQRRSIQNEQEAKRQGVTGVLNSLVPVLDSFEMALSASAPDAASSATLEGMKAVHQMLLAALGQHGIVLIKPQPGDDFDPSRHAALMQQPGTTADGEPVESGKVSAVLQVGYALGDRAIRSAKVAVAP